MTCRYWLTASLFTAILLIFGVAPSTAWAQTPTATVEDDNGAVVLQSFVDGALLAPGEQGTGTIPATGAGTRLMWYPAKAALRAGRVGSSQWDVTSVGNYSVAFGQDTEASGDWAMAIGQDTEASGDEATAMGVQTLANGFSSTAMGGLTTASGFVTVAMGNRTVASGDAATAMGRETVATGNWTTVMGTGTEAATEQSLSVGACNNANTSADGTLLVVGNGTYDFDNDNCSSTSDALVLEDNGSGGGNLTVNGDVNADNFNSSSDRRLKTAIEPIGEGVLTRLADLRPARYKFKNQETHPSGEQIGLVAQDVQEHFPELVSEGSGGMLSLAYPKMTAVLLKGLQEQQAQIEKKESRLKRQQEQIADLKSENQKIKKRQEKLEERLAALERQNSSALPAGLTGPWALALLLGLGGLAAGLLWRRGA